MYAYFLSHFGNNIKYLEYEMFFLQNLRKYTKYDIIYAYSEVDTPKTFLNIIRKMNLNIKFYKYNDNNITININKNFISHYSYFNVLRTCNYIFAYLLTAYTKICIIESDMFIIKNIDDIFKLKTPSAHYSYYKKNKFNENQNYSSNNKIIPKKNDNYNLGSPINGGIMLLNPSKIQFNKCLNILNKIITKNYKYPNEALFLMSNEKYYNLPVKYNFSHTFLESGFNKFDDIRLIHYDSSKYKLLDSIKEEYYKNHNNKLIKKYIAKKYYKDVYCKYKNKILKLLNIINDNK